jgi:hypothetical protein
MLLTVSDIFMLLFSALAVTVGMSIMWSNKFYKHPSTDMLFAAKFKMFSSGLLLLLIGAYGLISIGAKIL